MSPIEISLEVWKIIVSALTPIAIAVAGYFINKAIKTREHELTVLRSKQDIRKGIYDDIGPKLNKIFCFIVDVGDFGQYEPPHIRDLKDEINRKFHTYKMLWQDKTINAYDKFIESSYSEYSGGMGTPGKIRALTAEKKKFFELTGKRWKPEWDEMFTQPIDKRQMFTIYDGLVEAFIDDMTSGKLI